MTEARHTAQVVTVSNTHTYVLQEKELENVLMHPEVQNLPVVVVSVAGAYRLGKSFILNFFLRYLNSSPSARADGSWLNENDERLVGFSWRGGSKRNTTGILLWSEPIITSLASGEKVAVILMDTQGTFDSKSTVRDCSTIFALSTLLSSVQIYNLSTNIKEDDLQHLQLYTEYGRMVKDQGAKAFQVLEFLVRDWPYPYDYAYGEAGGKLLLQERLETYPDMDKELKELREHINSSFEQISCFLMPHPGLKVQKNTFLGNVNDLEPEFQKYLKELVSSLFGSEKLLPKTINGERVKARELFTYFKTYVNFFNSDQLPTATNIMKATADAIMLSAMLEARNLYETGMDSECGPAQPSVPSRDLQDLHQKYKTLALNAFTSKRKMGSKEEASKNLKILTKELENRLPQFLQSNMSKVQTVINKARDAYDKAIRNISKDKALCVHPLDLQQVHREGVAAAVQLFDASRKNISHRKDEERAAFISSFEEKYQLLRLTNEQNNKMAIQELAHEYFQHMQMQCYLEPPLTVSKFKSEHDRSLSKALEDFKFKRNRPAFYNKDDFKEKLIESITDSFDNLKKINKIRNKEQFQKALEKYNKYIENNLDGLRKCLHPEDFERELETAKCQALLEMRPSKQCSSGFDTSDEEENTLMKIVQQRYTELKSINVTKNEEAVAFAFQVYLDKMKELIGHPAWMVLLVPIFIALAKKPEYHAKSKTAAYEALEGKRLRSSYHNSDPYRDRLNKLMEDKYAKTNNIKDLPDSTML